MTTDALRADLDVAALKDRAIELDPWRRLDVVADTGSTNADLIARAQGGEDIAGAVLVADHQSRGRGRHGRSWSAPAKSQLIVSVGIDTAPVPADGWGWLPLVCGVAVVDALHRVAGVSARLKWPNDVLVDGRKLAGILAEVASPAAAVVVGVGLNVSLTEDELPVPTATSLLLLDSPVLDRTLLLTALLQALSTRVGAWQSAHGPDAALLEDYRRYSATFGERVRAELPGGGDVVGRAVDIDDTGRLLIDVGTRTVAVSAGDITHLRLADG